MACPPDVSPPSAAAPHPDQKHCKLGDIRRALSLPRLPLVVTTARREISDRRRESRAHGDPASELEGRTAGKHWAERENADRRGHEIRARSRRTFQRPPWSFARGRRERPR